MTLRLEDIELIKQLKHRYCRFLDTADAEGLSSVLTEDVEIDYPGATYHVREQGREAVVKLLTSWFHEDFVGCHVVNQPEITVHDDNTAEGRWTLTDFAMDLRTGVETTGACLYRDHYALVDGVWLIRRSTYRRLYERIVRHETPPEFPAHYLAEKSLRPEI
jgi:hypothetical protein